MQAKMPIQPSLHPALYCYHLPSLHSAVHNQTLTCTRDRQAVELINISHNSYAEMCPPQLSKDWVAPLASSASPQTLLDADLWDQLALCLAHRPCSSLLALPRGSLLPSLCCSRLYARGQKGAHTITSSPFLSPTLAQVLMANKDVLCPHTKKTL